MSTSNEIRRKLGIDPSRLRILSFGFLGVQERALLERIGVFVLDEEEERIRLETPYYEVLVEFTNADQASLFQTTAPNDSNGSQWWLPVRDSSGGVSLVRLRICFRDIEAAKTLIADTETATKFGYNPKLKQPAKISTGSTFRVLAEFSSNDLLNNLASFLNWYRGKSAVLPSGLTEIQARQLFDALTGVDIVQSEDRKGVRLSQGMPNTDKFFVDVDLWHPGSRDQLTEAINQFHSVVTNAEGRVSDGPSAVAQTMLLSRVEATPRTIAALLSYDRVAYVDLPPPPPVNPISAFDPIDPPDQLPSIPSGGPLACLVDSGVVAAHPLLAGLVVDERDFQSGENSPVDQCGHGTHLAGLIVYGDVSRCIRENQWRPRVQLLSAKVMRHVGNGVPGFDSQNEQTVLTQVRNAIRAYATEYGCRVFNLSIGDRDRVYRGGRQLPWALAIDELARELDIVIVVSIGNVGNPAVPDVRMSPQFEAASRDQLFAGNHLLIDPASALLALTVGVVSRTDMSFERPDRPGVRPPLVGAPSEGPPPFARVGQIESLGAAPQRAVKPDVCSYGGNLVLNAVGSDWRQHERLLDEPSLNFDYQSGRLLAGLNGSSVAAAAVTHSCAIVEAELRRINSERPSANLIRALVVHSARPAKTLMEWMAEGVAGSADGERRRLRVVGHGHPDPDRGSFSTDSRVTLISEDTIEEGDFHLYELELPDVLLTSPGKRRLRVTLAFDPPVRGTRKEYLGRTMWFQIFKGTTSDGIRSALAKTDGDAAPLAPSRELSDLKARPPSTMLEWSTVQSAEFETTRPRIDGFRAQPEGPPTIHILVGCSLRFSADVSTTQNYAVVASLEHDDAQVKLYQPIRQHVERQRERLRARSTG